MPKRRSQPQKTPAPAPSPPIDPPFTEEEIEQLRQFMAGIDPQTLSAAIEATEAALDTETVTVSRKDWHMYLLGAENMRRSAYESIYTPQPPGDWLTVEGAAKRADRDAQTIRRWARKGYIKSKPQRLGSRRLLYSWQSILLFLQAGAPEVNG